MVIFTLIATTRLELYRHAIQRVLVCRSRSVRSAPASDRRRRGRSCRCGSRASCASWWSCSSRPTTCRRATTRSATATNPRPSPGYACCRHSKRARRSRRTPHQRRAAPCGTPRSASAGSRRTCSPAARSSSRCGTPAPASTRCSLGNARWTWRKRSRKSAPCGGRWRSAARGPPTRRRAALSQVRARCDAATLPRNALSQTKWTPSVNVPRCSTQTTRGWEALGAGPRSRRRWRSRSTSSEKTSHGRCLDRGDRRFSKQKKTRRRRAAAAAAAARRRGASGGARRACAATPTTSCARCAPSRASLAARSRSPAPRPGRRTVSTSVSAPSRPVGARAGSRRGHGDGAQGQHVGGRAGGGGGAGGRRGRRAAGPGPAAAAQRLASAAARRDQHQHDHDKGTTGARDIARAPGVRRERRGARLVRQVLPARRRQVAAQAEDAHRATDHRAALQTDAQVPGKRSSGAYAGGDAVAALRRVRAQPSAGRRRDHAGQAHAAAAHVRLVPAVPRHLTGGRRVARLIPRAVARAPRLSSATAESCSTDFALSSEIVRPNLCYIIPNGGCKA